MSNTGAPLTLENIDYRQSGWNTIHNANLDKINDFAAALESTAALCLGKLTEKTATVLQVEAIMPGIYDYVMVSGKKVDVSTAVENDITAVELIDSSGAETGSTPSASTTYYAYLSNSEATLSEQLRLSATDHTNGYLATNWRYLGSVLLDATPEIDTITDYQVATIKTYLGI